MELPSRIVLASANPKKVAELREVLSSAVGTAGAPPDGPGVDGEGAPLAGAGSGRTGVELLQRPVDVPEVVEDAPDLEGNARLKAVALAGATGEAALADDSGLEVDALGGRPGVRSARYAGDDATDADNVRLLLAELERVGAKEPAQRRARFRCVVVLRSPEGDEVVAEGSVEGMIAAAPSGGGGFGYDPVFVPDEGDGRTFAQVSAEEKHAISHRGRALRDLVARLTPPA